MKQIIFNRLQATRYVSAAAAVLFAMSPVFSVQPASATDYDAEINKLKTQVNGLSGTAEDLHIEGNTLQQAVDNLQNKINGLQAKIAKNQTKKAELKQQIVKAEADIARRNAVLGENLRVMYLQGDVSTLEKVASSKSISEYIDKQEYRNRVQDRVKTAMEEIKQLKQQLEAQKKKVEQLIRDDKAMSAQIAKEKAKQAKLLATTRGKEAAYQKQIAGKKAQITRLQAEQAAINRANLGGGHVIAGDPGHGGYPAYLANAAKDSLVDPWGMYNRECVSYTAWKVHQKSGNMPYWGGRGNANQWPSSAAADGIPTGSTPRAGSVAISMAGYYGHAMWVESVNGNGTITVSQYNYDWQGYYSEMTISSGGLVYIYF